MKKLNKPLSKSQTSEIDQVYPKEEISNEDTINNIENVPTANSTDNSEVDLSENTSDNLDLGSSGNITYEGVSKYLTYKVITKEKYEPFWGPERYEITINFSDGKFGKLFFLRITKVYYFKKGNWAKY